MSTVTIVETLATRDELHAVVVTLRSGQYHVTMNELATGKVVSRRRFPLDLRGPALSFARELAWPTTAEDEAEDGEMASMLAEVADSVAAWKESAPSATSEVVRPAGSPTFVPSKSRESDRLPSAGFARTAHGRFPVKAVVDSKIRSGVVALARNLATRLEILRNANSWHAARELECEMAEFARSHGLGSSWIDVCNV